MFGESMATPGAGESEIMVPSPSVRSEFQVRASLLIDRHHRGLGTVFVARDVTEANNQSRRLAAAHGQLVRQTRRSNCCGRTWPSWPAGTP